jgi:protein TIF31
LGIIANMLANKVPQLSYISTIVVSEVIVRSAKHVFTGYIQNLDLTCLSAAISHFLNCFFCSGTQAATGAAAELVFKSSTSSSGSKRTRHKRQGRGGGVLAKASNVDASSTASTQASTTGPLSGDWSNLTSKILWSALNQEMRDYFHFDLNLESVESVAAVYGVQKISFLRALCQQTGIQLR